MNEKEIKKVNRSLLRYIYPDNWSDEKKEENPIVAQEIVEAIKDGKTVEIINAVIEGPFILKSVNVDGEITIQRTKIKDNLDWSYSTFKKVLNLNNSIFENYAVFNAVTIEKDIFLNEVTFREIVEFTDLIVMGVFFSRSTKLKKKANFDGSIFKKRIEFSNSTFEYEANFIGSKIGHDANFTRVMFIQDAIFNHSHFEGSAFFDQATFNGKADFGHARIDGGAILTETKFKQLANFNSAQIKWSAFFDQAIFEDEANFGNIRIGDNAEFKKAKFKKKANFNRVQIEGSAFFNQAIFEDDANFGNIRIGYNAEFFGVLFNHLANFNSAQIKWSAFFNQAIFEGEVDFTGAIIGDAEFSEVLFNQQTSFNRTQIVENAKFDLSIFKDKADFISARIGGRALFTDAEFKDIVLFEGAFMERDTSFKGTVFDDNVGFQNTSFRTIFFKQPKEQFHAKIDMRGCTYDSIHPDSVWEQLMEILDPYDRQPFTQLEDTFRRAGKDKLADEVYYEQKCRESALKTKRNPGDWLLDRFLKWFTGYGVRLYRLLFAIVPLLIFGTFIFHLDGSVVLESAVQPSFMTGAQISHLEAFWVSLNIFLPIEIPSGANWKASSLIIPYFGIKFTTFATFLNLAGWILVPVGVAGISGLLKRSK